MNFFTRGIINNEEKITVTTIAALSITFGSAIPAYAWGGYTHQYLTKELNKTIGFNNDYFIGGSYSADFGVPYVNFIYGQTDTNRVADKMLEIAAQKYGPNSGEYQYASGWKTHVEQDEYYVASFERGDFSSTYYGNLYKPDQNKAWVDKYVRDIYQEGQYSYIVNTDLIQETFTALSGIGSPSADYIKGSVAALKVWYDGKIKLVESQPHSGSNILTIQRVFSGYLSTFTNSNTFAKSLAAGNKISNNSIIAKDTKSKLTIEKKNEIKKQVADNLDVIVKENFEVKSVPEKNGFSKITITVKDQKKYEDSLNKFKVIEKVNNVDLNEVYDK